MKTNYYNVLDISEDANPEEIKSAFRTLSKNYHPDNLETGDRKKFEEIKSAYDILIDPEKRGYYDEFGEDPARRDEIITCAVGIFKKASEGNPYNIMNNIDIVYENIISMFTDLIDECNRTIDQTRATLKRIKKQPKNDFLSIVLNNEIANKLLMIGQHENRKEIAERAIVMLKDYSFEEVERKEQVIRVNGTSLRDILMNGGMFTTGGTVNGS